MGKEGLGKGVRELSEASQLMREREREREDLNAVGPKGVETGSTGRLVASAGQTGLARLTKKMISYGLII